MKEKFPGANKQGMKISLIIFSIAILLLMIHFSIYMFSSLISSPGNNEPITKHSNQTDAIDTLIIYKEKPEFQKIQIPEQGLSKLIEIPGGRCFWISDNPGWLEYYFLTGKEYVKTFTVAAGEQKSYSGIFPSRKFKLKGQPGIARIWLQPCPGNSVQKKMTYQKNQLCDSDINDYSENSTACSVSIQ